jgi:hypothetical protein
MVLSFPTTRAKLPGIVSSNLARLAAIFNFKFFEFTILVKNDVFVFKDDVFERR